MDGKRDYNLKSAENTLHILDYFGTTCGQDLSISDIQKALGMSKSMVFRNVKILAKHGYIELHENTGKYRLGIKVVDLASYKIDMLEIRTESLPVLMMVQARTSASISLCELQGLNVVKLFMIRGNLIIHKNSHTLEKLPAYCSSPGKCLLSALSSVQLDELFEGYKFVKYTDTTIVSLANLKEELKQIREQGFAINRGEQEEYTRSIAVPIFGYSGNIIASISAGTSKEEFTKGKQEQCLLELQNAASIISRKMGGI